MIKVVLKTKDGRNVTSGTVAGPIAPDFIQYVGHRIFQRDARTRKTLPMPYIEIVPYNLVNEDNPVATGGTRQDQVTTPSTVTPTVDRAAEAIKAAVNILQPHLRPSHRRIADELIPARDGIEAQRGLNDVFPGDPTPRSSLTVLEAMAEKLGVEPKVDLVLGAINNLITGGRDNDLGQQEPR